MMKWRRFLPACALALMPLGCSSSVAAPVDATGTLFEIEYVNYAWLPTWEGFVVDTAGVVHRFDRDGEAWGPAGRDYHSAAELESKWARGSEPVREVDRARLADMTALVPAAAAGTLSEPKNHCADAGTLTYSAYLYEPSRNAFRRVVLRREGDTAQLNESAAGRALASWLASLELRSGIEGCQP